MENKKKDTNKILEISNLRVQYTSDGKPIYAINGVNLSLEKGKTLALVGETGAGKTTIAKSILQILPDRGAKITDGAIYVDGTDVLKLSEKELLKIRGYKVSMIFQDPMTALNPSMKIGKQVSEVIQIHNKITKEEANERAKEMLKQVGILPERFNEYPHQFSGGMKQRVVIAIALACKPDLLLADEPTTALDVTIQAQVLALIRELKEKNEMSLVLITHDLGVVANISDEVAIVYSGEILECGSKEEIFQHPSHPYTRGLFAALPDIEIDTDRLENIPGLPPDPSELMTGCVFAPRCKYACAKCSEEKPELVTINGTHQCKCPYWKIAEEVSYGKIN